MFKKLKQRWLENQKEQLNEKCWFYPKVYDN